MSELTSQEAVVPQIKKAAVIDDAFDDVIEGEILLNNFLEFLQIANEKENEFDTLLEKLNISVPDTSDWDDSSEEYLSFLRILWEKREDQELLPLINSERLFADKLQKLDYLNNLCANIEEQDIIVERFKSTIDDLTIFQRGDFVYIFLDYNLGVRTGEEAILNAQKVIKKIYDICPEPNKPVTILMSSDPNVDKQKEAFQQGAQLLEGVFRFSPKKDLQDKGKVSLLARAYGEEFYSNHALQEYIQSLIVAAKEAQSAFTTEVNTLKIEDYEFIQNSVLQEQQQPLGDYLAWLYGSHWANLLLRNENLKAQQDKIDKVISEKTPLHHSLPSEKLSEIFLSALFEENLGEIKHHPWEGIEATVAELPYLHLGDIFTKSGDQKLYMILNPQCDLERPDCRSLDQSIFFVPGIMDSLENVPPSHNSVKTDFFIFEDERYRIYWDLKKVRSMPYSEVEAWLANEELKRNFRLRLPFALDIQQRFTSNMSRVGLPVSPPISKKITLRVSYSKYDGSVIEEFIPKSDNYAFFARNRNGKDEIRLTLNFALDFKAKLTEELETLEKERHESVDKSKIGKAINKISAFLQAFDVWYFEKRGFGKPGENKIVTLKNDAVSVMLDSEQYAAPTPFLIDIITKVATANEIEEEVIEVEPKKKKEVLKDEEFLKTKKIKNKNENGESVKK